MYQLVQMYFKIVIAGMSFLGPEWEEHQFGCHQK